MKENTNKDVELHIGTTISEEMIKLLRDNEIFEKEYFHRNGDNWFTLKSTGLAYLVRDSKIKAISYAGDLPGYGSYDNGNYKITDKSGDQHIMDKDGDPILTGKSVHSWFDSKNTWYTYKDNHGISYLIKDGEVLCKGRHVNGYANDDYKYEDQDGIEHLIRDGKEIASGKLILPFPTKENAYTYTDTNNITHLVIDNEEIISSEQPIYLRKEGFSVLDKFGIAYFVQDDGTKTIVNESKIGYRVVNTVTHKIWPEKFLDIEAAKEALLQSNIEDESQYEIWPIDDDTSHAINNI